MIGESNEEGTRLPNKEGRWARSAGRPTVLQRVKYGARVSSQQLIRILPVDRSAGSWSSSKPRGTGYIVQRIVMARRRF